MKVRLNRWYNAVLTVLLSMLGFGCSSSDDDVVVEYGTPHSDYILKGLVTDEAGTPVKNIKMSAKILSKTEAGAYMIEIGNLGTAQTDESGRYVLEYAGMARTDLKIVVEDIDGDANGGEFLNDTLDVDFRKAVKVGEGDNHWYGGKFEVTTDVKLKKK